MGEVTNILITSKKKRFSPSIFIQQQNVIKSLELGRMPMLNRLIVMAIFMGRSVV